MWKDTYGMEPFLELTDSKELKKLKCLDCELVFYSPEIAGDGSFYQKLSKFSWYYEDEKWEFNEACSIIADKKPHSLLEVGCGFGHFLSKVQNAVSEVSGVEINPEAVKRCQEKGFKVFLDLDTISQKFDMIVMFQVLEHIQSPGEFIKKLISLLAPGGYVIIVVPNPNSYLKDVEYPLLDMPPHHFTGWNKRTFLYLAEKYKLNMLCYINEPLRVVDFKSYIQSCYEKNVTVFKPGFFKRIIGRISTEYLKLMAPIYKDKVSILGQSHLVMLENSNPN